MGAYKKTLAIMAEEMDKSSNLYSDSFDASLEDVQREKARTPSQH